MVREDQDCGSGHCCQCAPTSHQRGQSCEDQVAKLLTFADPEISDMRFRRIFQQGTANSQQLQEMSSQFLCSLKEVDAMQNRTAKHMETVSQYLGEMQRNDILN
jgi:hypothetical protein